jgi:hypothetical protein
MIFFFLYAGNFNCRWVVVLIVADQKGEDIVNSALKQLFNANKEISLESVLEKLKLVNPNEVVDVTIQDVDLSLYDNLLNEWEAVYG